jgi:hypothetical protein
VFEIRTDRRPQGPKKLRAERQANLDLVKRGVSTSEACRLVGINRKTGHRCRYGKTAGPKAGQQSERSSVARPSAESGRYLSQDERIVIADRLRAGASQAAIAAELGRPRCTISRRSAVTGIQAAATTGRSQRRSVPAAGQGRGALRRELTAVLRTGRAVRRPRRQPGQRQPRFAYPMVMISERPAPPGHPRGRSARGTPASLSATRTARVFDHPAGLRPRHPQTIAAAELPTGYMVAGVTYPITGPTPHQDEHHDEVRRGVGRSA